MKTITVAGISGGRTIGGNFNGKISFFCSLSSFIVSDKDFDSDNLSVPKVED